MGMTNAEKSARYRAKDVEAYRAKKREYASTSGQRAKRAEYMRRWREANREKFNAQARASHHRNKHKHVARNRELHLRAVYGISQADFERMLASQSGRCAICDQPPKPGAVLAVDHCHGTGRVRALLCTRCNTQLGWFEKYQAEVMNYLLQHAEGVS